MKLSIAMLAKRSTQIFLLLIMVFVRLGIAPIYAQGVIHPAPLTNLGSFKSDQIRVQIISPSLSAESIDTYLFNFGFISRLRLMLSTPPDGPMAYLNVAHYQLFLPYKKQIDDDYRSMDEFINKIANQIGVSRETVYSAFGIGFNSDGSVNEDISSKAAINGRLTADQYWLRYPLNSQDTRSINDWYDSRSPAVLFNEFYPSLILGFNNLLPKIYSAALSVSNQYSKNQQEYAERQRWLQSPEGQKYQLEQANRERQAAEAEQAKLLKDYPFYAVITCEINGSNFSAFGCFDGRVQTQLELRNGSDYNLYQAYQLNQIGQQKSSGLIINLKNSFSLKAQNSSFNSILGVKIIDRENSKIVFQKKVGTYGVISIKN